MLNTIISSKIRRTLLNAFFSSKETELYTRQLAATYHISVGTTHRELSKLAASGIIKSRRVGNIKFYSLNRQNPVFHELKNLFFKTASVVELIKSALASVKGIDLAFIYGSFAKDRAESDVDLIIVGDSIDQDAILRSINKVEKELYREINYSIYSRKEYAEKKKIGDSFLSEVLNNKTVALKGDINAY